MGNVQTYHVIKTLPVNCSVILLKLETDVSKTTMQTNHLTKTLSVKLFSLITPPKTDI